MFRAIGSGSCQRAALVHGSGLALELFSESPLFLGPNVGEDLIGWRVIAEDRWRYHRVVVQEALPDRPVLNGGHEVEGARRPRIGIDSELYPSSSSARSTSSAALSRASSAIPLSHPGGGLRCPVFSESKRACRIDCTVLPKSFAASGAVSPSRSVALLNWGESIIRAGRCRAAYVYTL